MRHVPTCTRIHRRAFDSMAGVTEVSQVSVRILGPIQAFRSGSPRRLPSRRQRALLAALAVRGGRPVSVSELVDAVWDDDPPEQARTTLQTYVSRLRNTLGPDAILHDPAGYRLAQTTSTDVVLARAAVARLERLDPSDHRGRADVAMEALELWAGPALGELAEHEWFRGQIVELSEMRANLVDIAAEGLLMTARGPQAVALLEVSIATDPLREPTQILLVRALHAAGRTTDALRAASRYRRQLRDETGLTPGTRFAEVEARVLSGDEPPPRTPVDGGLGEWSATSLARLTPIIGRVGELDELEALLSWARLVTVTGVGGVGKTRLVAELLERQSRACKRLVVELAPVAPGGVVAAVASAVGFRAGNADRRTVADLLRSEQLLVTLDNAEHVVDEVRDLARVVLDGCPGVQIVTTSRERLDLPDEVVVALDPLPTAGQRSEAVELFIDRVRRARPRFDLDPADPAIAELCRRVDGVPLALELAASRAAVLGVSVLNERLGSSGALLVDVGHDRGRHASLGNVVSWSVDLLGAPARSLLVALSVFQGEFDLAAAEAVGSAVVDESVPLLLGRLVDTSLVGTPGTPGRYRLLEMVRTFAYERLQESERFGAVRSAHAKWISTRMSEIDALSAGPREVMTVSRCDEIRYDTKAALRWAVDSGDIDTAASIAVSMAGPLLYRPDQELIDEIRSVSTLRSIQGAAREATLLAAGARAAFLLGNFDDVEELAHRALDLAHGDAGVRHRAQHALGVVRLYQGRFAESVQQFEHIVSDQNASIVDRLDALGGLGLALCYQGDNDAAQHLALQHRALSDAIGSDTYLAFADYVQAEIHLADGDIERAAGALTAAAERAWRVRAAFVWGIASTVLASVLVRHRPPQDARRHLPTLVERWRRSATWPQLWTTLRLVAEHLAATGVPRDRVADPRSGPPRWCGSGPRWRGCRTRLGAARRNLPPTSAPPRRWESSLRPGPSIAPQYSNARCRPSTRRSASNGTRRRRCAAGCVQARRLILCSSLERRNHMSIASDVAAVEAFAARTVDRLASAWTIAAIHIGDRLGLYAALAEGSGTAADIAARAATNARLTREWLDGQVVAGIVELAHDGRYTLPAEHAAVLAIDDSPAFLAGAGGVLAAVFQAEERIVGAFRGDGKLAWGDQAPCLFGAVDRFYRTGYKASLVAEWITSLERASTDLARGGRVADVGCGRGTALVMLAEAFPASTFVGIDSHEPSLARAGEHIASAGVGSRVRLERASAATFGGGPFDLICFLDALHDMGDPSAAIRNAHDQLAVTGSVMLVEPAARESVHEGIGDLAAQLYYPGSAFLCTPNAISQGDTALGNQVPEATWRELFTRAGFSSFTRVATTPFNRVFEARR